MAVTIDPHTLYTLTDISTMLDVPLERIQQASKGGPNAQLKGARLGVEFYVRGDHLLEYFGALVANGAGAFAPTAPVRESDFLSAGEMAELDESMPKVIGGKVKTGMLKPPAVAPKSAPAPSASGPRVPLELDNFEIPRRSGPIGAAPQPNAPAAPQPSFQQPAAAFQQPAAAFQQPGGAFQQPGVGQGPGANAYHSVPTGAFNFVRPGPEPSAPAPAPAPVPGPSRQPIPNPFGQPQQQEARQPIPNPFAQQSPQSPWPQQPPAPQQAAQDGQGRRSLAYDPDELLRQVEDLERQRRNTQ
jgi:hypothetical protein